jgi:two-component system, NarL family, sensor histidine kinase DesK
MIDTASHPERRPLDAGSDAPHEAGARPPLPQASRRELLPPLGRSWRPINLLWLVYTVFFLTGPLQNGSRRDWIVLAGVFACFVTLYVLFLWVRSVRTRRALLLAIAALGCAYYPMNVSAGGCMFIYVACLAAYTTTSLAAAAGTVIAATLAAAAEGMLLHLNPWAWGSMALVAGTVGTGNLVAALRAGAHQRLGLAQEQIEHLAKLAERERIARDLHDVLGHTLSVVVLKSELAGKLIGADAERARREIGEVEQIARQALSEVREAIRGYRAGGIVAEIGRARRALDAAGVRLEWQTPSLRLEPAHESVLSLVLREAVTNILRHAGATSCRLELAADGGGTRLTVHDNGRGAGEYSGNGLRGMRERVEALGGRLRIDFRQGTCLTVEIPAWLGA